MFCSGLSSSQLRTIQTRIWSTSRIWPSWSRKELSRRFYGLCFKDLQSMAHEFAEASGIQHSFDRVSRLAGRDWVYGFLKRNGTTVIENAWSYQLRACYRFSWAAVVYLPRKSKRIAWTVSFPARENNYLTWMRVVLVQCQINSGESLVRRVVM